MGNPSRIYESKTTTRRRIECLITTTTTVDLFLLSCNHAAKTRVIEMNLKRLTGRRPKSAVYRFNASHAKNKETGCWDWLGKSRSGSCKLYGRIKVNGKTIAAHRYSWELHNNAAIPDGMIVMHTCDNPACVNPDHLVVGTHQDNMDDMLAKGRQSRSNHPRVRGEENGNAKIGEKEALAIFLDKRPQRAIAKEYGITQAAVSLIKRKKTWRHIHD